MVVRSSEAGQKHREREGARRREQSLSVREIGPCPPVKNARRRNACKKSLRLFCERYMRQRFFFGWSADHLKVIAKLEAAVLHGGLFALAMPRGSGKTSLAEAAALWAILYGHRRFVVLIGATDQAACEMLDSIKVAVETYDELFEDFPKACLPIRKMEGISNRVGGQLMDGERTRVTWKADEAVFPTAKGSPSSGSIIRVAGITGRIRGMKAALASGETIRPDFAIADDPQTDQSATSLVDIDKREQRLRGAVKGLAGPGKTIAMVVPCTVIAPGDLSDRILDRERNPQFVGERMRMLYAFPTHTHLWDEYAELRRQSFAEDGRGEKATEFYRANRALMDEGASVAWPDRFDKELEDSGLQAAMNLHIDNPREFRAEYQNDPEPPGGSGSVKEHDPRALVKRLSGLPRLEVPKEAVRLTAMVDVGGLLHWYAVVAWDGTFGGSVIDYGTWPRQSRQIFSKRDTLNPSLADVYPGLSETQRAYAGLRDLTNEVLGRSYFREKSGEELRVERCLVDAGWETPTVHQFCRQSPHAGILYPSKGVGRTTLRTGVSEWKPRPGERVGPHWRLTMSRTERGRMVQFDPDAWKSRLWEILTSEPGGRGYLSFYGGESRAHELLAEHVAAESAEPVTIRGNTFDKWAVLPHNPDNDFLDTLVGCAVAASVQGLTWDSGAAAGDPMQPVTPRGRVSFREMQQRQKNKGVR